MQIPVDLQKGLLINVPRLVRRSQKVYRQTKHTTVMRPDKALKGVMIATLRCPDQPCFVSGIRPDVRQNGTHRSRGIVHLSASNAIDELPAKKSRRNAPPVPDKN